MKRLIQERISLALSSAIGMDSTTVMSLLEAPKNRSFGDLAFPCFEVAKLWKSAPPACAQKLANELKLPSGVASAVPQGPFLNFCYDRAPLVKSITESVLSGKLAPHAESSQRIALEYSSPNIAKPFHIGHLRATLIGNCLERVYRYLGYHVTSINHLGDWGTQFGFVWAGCKLWGKPTEASVGALVSLYKRATALKTEQAKNPALVAGDSSADVNQIARDFFLDLERGESYAVEFWRWCREISLKYLQEAYDRLGVRFDHYLGESFYSDKLDSVRDELKRKGLLKESQGALGVELGEELGFARIATPDGRSLYFTRDLAAAKYRAETFPFDRSVYVVGAPQTLHFQQLRAVLALMGADYANKIVHVPFGHVLGMKTRGDGEIVELGDLLDEAVERALIAYREQVSKRPEGLDELRVASTVAIAAIVFSDLSRSRTKDVHFSWEHALAFAGDSGPYLLYAYARINGIREKASADGLAVPMIIDGSLLVDDESFTLASLLEDFPEILQRTIEEYEPAVLAGYALDLAKALSKAYAELKVVGVERKLAEARLGLLDATRITLGRALDLLGITPLERM